VLCAGINPGRFWKNCLLPVYLGNELILTDAKRYDRYNALPILSCCLRRCLRCCLRRLPGWCPQTHHRNAACSHQMLCSRYDE